MTSPSSIPFLLLILSLARAEDVWPTSVIPFVVDPLLEENAERLLALDNALSFLSSSTCLSFVRRSTQLNFVTFAELPENVPCWSLLSRAGAEQTVNVGGNCMEPVVLPATVTRIFSDCDIQKVQYLYPCPGVPPIKQTNCTSIFGRVNNVAASVVPCSSWEPDSCPFPTYRNNSLPVGSACSSACDYGGDLLPLLRSFNSQFGVSDHFYSTDSVASGTLSAEGYSEEDPVGYLGSGGSNDSFCSCLLPLHRLFNKLTNDHFYTTTEMERELATRLGYVFERTEGYCTKEPACGAYMPLHRFYHPLLADHLYTTNAAEVSFLRGPLSGYLFERIECYLWQYSAANRACETV